ncbi:MAG: hypothetical protein AAB450_00180, partial [Patescibacteria group bacterium]
NADDSISAGLPETPNATFGSNDIFISVFNSSGTYQWGKRLGGTDSDDAPGVATDSNNNVIVTGYVVALAGYSADFDGDGSISAGLPETGAATYSGDYDVLISVFNSSGTYQWGQRLGNTSALFYSYGISITADSNNRIISCGLSGGNIDLDGDGSISAGLPETTTGTYGGNDIFLAVFNPPDTTPPVPSSISPASASTITDTTQTITFTTDENATCYLSLDGDEAYADMADDTLCTGGGTTSQSCTTPDLGADGSKSVYIACTDGTNADTALTNEGLTYTLDTTPPAPTVTAVGGDTASTWSTSDTSPLITLTLNENGDCYASETDEAYDDMS